VKRHLLLAILSLALLGSSTTVAHADLRIRTAEVLPTEGDPTEPSRAYSGQQHYVDLPGAPDGRAEPAVVRTSRFETFFRTLFWRVLWTVR
jgi:hypothetical protein